MTPDEIILLANERYILKKGACRIERKIIADLRAKFIDKLMKQYGHIKVNS